MQRELLSRLAGEAARLCQGAPIRSVICRPDGGLALLFDGDTVPALELAPGPTRPRLAATRIRLRAADESHASLVGQVKHAFSGYSVQRMGLLGGERIARIEVENGQSLILEIMGAASNLFWIGSDGRILGRFRRVVRPGGALCRGESWHPPPPRPGVLATAAVWHRPSSEPPPNPGLGARRDILGLDALEDVSSTELTVRVDGPGAGESVFVSTDLLGDALLRHTFWFERQAAVHRRRESLYRIVKQAQARLGRLDRALAREEAEGANAGALRRQAEAILAGLRTGHRDGARFKVSDPYSTDGAVLDIPIDPALDNQANASRLFRRAGRLERVHVAAVRKRREGDGRRDRLDALAGRLAEVEHEAELAPIETELRAAVASRRPPAQVPRCRRPSSRATDPRARRVRRYPLDGGWHALVGGNGADNDYLTFRVAAPHDFWLHVADYPGAHVVVRNSGRRVELPAPVLRQAAALAAHFSRAPRELPVDVRWTPVRHVRKGKGLPAGAVLLPRFSTVSVRAAAPAGGHPLT